MSFISGFLDKTAKLYDITTSTSTATGQPIEILVFKKNVKVFFSPRPSRIYRLFDPGQIRTDSTFAISIVKVVLNQVLEIDNVKYRVTAANAVELKKRVYAYIIYLERFEH